MYTKKGENVKRLEIKNGKKVKKPKNKKLEKYPEIGIRKIG